MRCSPLTWVCVCALGVAPLVGCGDNNGGGGSGGSAGTGGMTGAGGSAGGGGGTAGIGVECSPIGFDPDCTDPCLQEIINTSGFEANVLACQKPETLCLQNLGLEGQCLGCYFDWLDCTRFCANGPGPCDCEGDFTRCSGISETFPASVACVDGVCPCTEAGLRAAIAEGGGSFTFDCNGPTTVVTFREIAIDSDTTLDGGQYLTVDGNEGHRVFSVAEGVAAQLRGLTVVGGVAAYPDSGGGILNRGQLRLSNSIVRENEAADDFECCRDPRFNQGGGISNHGNLIVVDSEVSANTAFAGAGIWNLGTLSVAASTLSGNTGAEGTGVFNALDASANVANSTVSGNAVEAIHNRGILVVVGSTISAEDSEDRNTIVNSPLGELTVANTIVDGSCGGALASRGYNLESPGDTCGFDQTSDQVKVSADDLKLGPLQDEGGPTMTHALLPGSIAIDAIDAEDCVDADGEPLTTDQRGVSRPQGDSCDIGAFELEQGGP